MPKLSTARQFFDLIFAENAFQFLESLPTSDPRTFESEWLECKGGEKLTDPLPIFSEAVSGFANTQGGVLIFGLDAREKIDGIDAVSGVSFVAEAAALRSKLQKNVHCTTDPPALGIEIREVVRPGEKQGFVVCFIPESENRPHRSEQVKNKPYQLRSGDSFTIMNPSVLRAMFYPQTTPDIRLALHVRWDVMSIYEPCEITFALVAANVGGITVEDLVMSCSELRSPIVSRKWVADGLNISRRTVFLAPRSIHPDTESEVLSFSMKGKTSLMNEMPETSPFYLDIDISAKDMPRRYFRSKIELARHRWGQPIWLQIVEENSEDE